MHDTSAGRTHPPPNVTATACVLLVMLISASSAWARVEVNVTRVGFPTLRSGHVVRAGEWVPVVVDLALIEQARMDGSLRLAQLDDDGDECYDSVEVHLLAETGGAQQYHLYVPANPLRGAGKFFVELISPEGAAVEVVSQGELTYRAKAAQHPTVLSDDDLLVLSVATSAIGRVSDLSNLEGEARFRRPIHVGHLSPHDLPELWLGLEIVDVVVWDDASPEDLTSRQLAALLEWVRQGGTLLLAASRTAGSIALTKPLDAVLPVHLGDVVSDAALRDVRYRLLGPPWLEEPGRSGEIWEPADLPKPVPVVRCTPRDDAKVIARETSIDASVVTRRREGRGHIIFSAVTLRDLFSGEGRAVEFFRGVLRLGTADDPEEGPAQPVSLFRHVVAPVSFSTSGTLYLFVAGISSIVYVLVATFGTWGFLRRRGWRRHSWSAFALTALAAGFLSLVAVNWLQGLGDTLHQFSIIDARAGQAYGYATVFFGLKTSSDKNLDIWLPSNPLGATSPTTTNVFLRPIPAGALLGDGAGSFADPQEYRLHPATAVLRNVRFRATLKQFEGRWRGVLRGRITGRVAVTGRWPVAKITDDSYIVNELGVDLSNCWLLHPTLDIEEWKGVRSDQIYAYPLGDVPGDGSRINLAERCYQPAPDQTVAQFMQETTLGKAQQDWSAPFRPLLSSMGLGARGGVGVALGEEQKALLLLTTIGEFNPLEGVGTRGFLPSSYTWSRDRVRQLDLGADLEPGHVVFIGFANDAGAARLFRRRSGEENYTVSEPDPGHARTMYRISIPVTLLDSREDASKPREPKRLGVQRN